MAEQYPRDRKSTAEKPSAQEVYNAFSDTAWKVLAYGLMGTNITDSEYNSLKKLIIAVQELRKKGEDVDPDGMVLPRDIDWLLHYANVVIDGFDRSGRRGLGSDGIWMLSAESRKTLEEVLACPPFIWPKTVIGKHLYGAELAIGINARDQQDALNYLALAHLRMLARSNSDRFLKQTEIGSYDIEPDSIPVRIDPDELLFIEGVGAVMPIYRVPDPRKSFWPTSGDPDPSLLDWILVRALPVEKSESYGVIQGVEQSVVGHGVHLHEVIVTTDQGWKIYNARDQKYGGVGGLSRRQSAR